jgi:hypothetical protein
MTRHKARKFVLRVYSGSQCCHEGQCAPSSFHPTPQDSREHSAPNEPNMQISNLTRSFTPKPGVQTRIHLQIVPRYPSIRRLPSTMDPSIRATRPPPSRRALFHASTRRQPPTSVVRPDTATIYAPTMDDELVERDEQGQYKVNAPSTMYKHLAMGTGREADEETGTLLQLGDSAEEGG